MRLTLVPPRHLVHLASALLVVWLLDEYRSSGPGIGFTAVVLAAIGTVMFIADYARLLQGRDLPVASPSGVRGRGLGGRRTDFGWDRARSIRFRHLLGTTILVVYFRDETTRRFAIDGSLKGPIHAMVPVGVQRG